MSSCKGSVGIVTSLCIHADAYRLALIEIRDKISRPTMEFPDEEAPLPSDLEPISTVNLFEKELFELSPLSLTYTRPLSWFARQAQALRLFDHALKTVNLSMSREAKISELKQVDAKLQGLLSKVMEEPGPDNLRKRSAVMAAILRYGAPREVQMYQRPNNVQNSLRFARGHAGSVGRHRRG